MEAITIEGKKIAVVSEYSYSTSPSCPHCASLKNPTYLSGMQDLEETIVDLLKCSETECNGVYIVLTSPRIYNPKPIYLRWKYTGKGERKDDHSNPRG